VVSLNGIKQHSHKYNLFLLQSFQRNDLKGQFYVGWNEVCALCSAGSISYFKIFLEITLPVNLDNCPHIRQISKPRANSTVISHSTCQEDRKMRPLKKRGNENDILSFAASNSQRYSSSKIDSASRIVRSRRDCFE
jgi:hypothetical protein